MHGGCPGTPFLCERTDKQTNKQTNRIIFNVTYSVNKPLVKLT